MIVGASLYEVSGEDFERALKDMQPLEEMRKARMKQIAEKLAEGVAVSLTCGGRTLVTFYPDGTIESDGLRTWPNGTVRG